MAVWITRSSSKYLKYSIHFVISSVEHHCHRARRAVASNYNSRFPSSSASYYRFTLSPSSSRCGSRSSRSPPHASLIGGGSQRMMMTMVAAGLFSWRRFESTKAADIKLEFLGDDGVHHDDVNGKLQGIDFPGGRVPFTSESAFIPEFAERVPCFRVLDDSGRSICGKRYEQIAKEVAMKIYTGMVTLQIMDTVFYEAQRQGRISFYLTSLGEEAVNLASAAALSTQDPVFAQYREPGMLLWRGFTLQEFADQCFGNKADHGKGRQMPIHYGSKKFNVFTISSPIATQLPQAVGAAYSVKMDNKDACVIAYMGDGCTSEGDFHAGLNFAAVLEVPIVFICRNNGWAISTPITEQFRSDGIVVKGQGYGIRSTRVDGNDALAVYNVVREAREMAVKEKRPILIEALTYRVGHHSTSDDSTKYRPHYEIERWKMVRNPLTRFRKWLEAKGWWNDKQEADFRSSIKEEMIQAIQAAERMEKPQLSELFSDVYDVPTSSLHEQEQLLRKAVKRNPQDYPSNVPL